MSLVQIFHPCLLLSSSTGYETFKHGFQISKHFRACRHVEIGPVAYINFISPKFCVFFGLLFLFILCMHYVCMACIHLRVNKDEYKMAARYKKILNTIIQNILKSTSYTQTIKIQC